MAVVETKLRRLPTAGTYVSHSLLAHLALVLTGFVAFMMLIELMNRSEEVAELHGGGALTLLKYAGLRLPDVATFILPFAVLMATLLLLSKLARNNEIMALKAAGLSFYRLLLSMLPAALLVGLVHFIISDQVVPRTSRILSEWDAAAQAERTAQNLLTTATRRGVWLRDGSSIVHIEVIMKQGTELSGVTIYERSSNGVLARRLVAKRSSFDGVSWRMFEVQKLPVAGRQEREPEVAAEMPWEAALTPGHLVDLSTDPATLSVNEVYRFVANPEVGARPVDLYETWLLRKAALPLVTLMMVLLAAPVAQGLHRHGGIGIGLAAGVALGFLYFVTDGLLLTLGEIGTVPPAVAALSPLVLFGAVGTGALLKIEGY